MDHVLHLIDIRGLSKLSGLIVDLFEQTTSPFTDSILVRRIPVDEYGLDAMAFQSFNELSLELQALVQDEEAWRSEDPQPTPQERLPHHNAGRPSLDAPS